MPQPPTSVFALNVTPGCATQGGTLTFSDSGYGASSYEYIVWQSSAMNVVLASGTISPVDLPFELPEHFANGTYTVEVTPAGDAPAQRNITVSCTGPTLKIKLANVVPTAPTAAGGTGSVTFDVTGNGTRPFDVYLYRQQLPGQLSALVFQQLGATNPLDFEITGLAPTSYNLYVYAVTSPPAPVSEVDVQSFTVNPFVPAPRGGCTDRQATNYDGSATFDDGSCEYLPQPVPEPIFAVPLLNPLRFVQLEVPDNCQTFETLDNTLFCQQRRPGQQRRPLFCQPVAYCDPVALQVLTNFDTVEAVVHDHASGQVRGPVQSLSKVMALQGMAPFAPVELSSAGDGNTYLISATGGLPASLLAAARVSLRLDPAGPAQQYRVLRSGRASATVNDDYLVLNRPWTGPVAGFPAVSWLLSGPGFNVWEGLLDLSGYPPGTYEIRLHGYDNANRSATAVSEPLALAAEHENTVVVEYGNRDNAYGMVLSTGIRPRLRVPGTFFRSKNAGTTTIHRNSDDSTTVLASTAQRRTLLETYYLPDWLHEKLFLATRLDLLRVNGQLGTAPEAYDWTPERLYPLSSGRVNVEHAKWLGSGNGDDTGANDTGDGFLVLRTGGFLKLHKR